MRLPAALRFFPRPLKSLIRLLFDSCVLACCSKRQSQTEIGAIFLLHGLGDVILGARAVESLHDHLHQQGLRSRLFVDKVNYDFARAYLRVDEVVGLEWIRFEHDATYRARILRRLAQSGKYRAAYQPTLNRRLAVEDSLMRATGAPERFGLEGSNHFIQAYEKVWGARFYSQLVKLPPGDQHDLDSYRDFLTALGIGYREEPWRLHPGSSSLSPSQPFMVISDQASNQEKRWPLERFLEVAEKLAGPRQWKVVAVGKPEPLTLPPWVVDLRGLTDGAELPRLLFDARFILTNDSGPFHLGIALSRPTVAVAGGGLPQRYFPYPKHYQMPMKVLERRLACAGCGWRCAHVVEENGVASCVSQVSTGQVLQAAEELLKRWGL